MKLIDKNGKKFSISFDEAQNNVSEARDKEDSVALTLPVGYRLLGCFEIRRIIGIGGFGITYEVLDVRSGERCALKELFIKSALNRNPDGITVRVSDEKKSFFDDCIKSFLEEASILKKLSATPNVVKIYDAFLANNTAYFIMRLVNGKTLKSIMKMSGGSIPFTKNNLHIMNTVALTMDYVHNMHGISHRDISPENIMLVNNEPVLIDFGNAKNNIWNQSREEFLPVILKPSFAPPEQYTGKNQGTWTDLYSLAATFYFAFTGERVPIASQREKGAGYESFSSLVPGSSNVLSNVIDDALEMDYEKRRKIVSMKKFADVINDEIQRIDNSLREIKQEERLWAYIRVIIGGQAIQEWKIPKDDVVIIGSNPKFCNIVISTERIISKQHLIVKYDSYSNKFRVTDISTNGSYINNNRMKKNIEYEVKPDTVISIVSMYYAIKVGVGE